MEEPQPSEANHDGKPRLAEHQPQLSETDLEEEEEKTNSKDSSSSKQEEEHSEGDFESKSGFSLDSICSRCEGCFDRAMLLLALELIHPTSI